MKRFFHFASLAALALCLFLLAGCGTPRPQATAPRPEGTLAIAGFTNPTNSWQLLAGYVPKEGAKPLSQEILLRLDGTLQDTLNAHGVVGYKPAAITRQCQDIVVFEEVGVPRMSAFKYWLGVGKCMAVEYLLVPQVIEWDERQGGDMGVEAPAAVVLDFFLINVKDETMIRAHFSETQESLTENIFKAKSFFKRGGKWVTAHELASEGIDQKLTELGL
ncbi:hypothetical protein [Salidesulfovibrio onnuriiensis]|uniref:hypothetical protein n=1 Tax=Salidesulfovibrio onnuriiensis TaxID=2583823 RepID=UPI0011CC9ABC|nr:hypothetical protein [Salidesulfovibrio onnuriiensis]